MLNILYITHLGKQQQKGLAYAYHLAKVLSGKLSLLPILRIFSKPRKGITIWKPLGNAFHRILDCRLPRGLFLPGKKRKSIDLMVFSRPRTIDHAREEELRDLVKMFAAPAPVLFLPYDYPFSPIKNILFTGNAPGFADHPLKHQLAATFIPRAYQVVGEDVQPIHWNNVCKIPENDRHRPLLSPARLLGKIAAHKIDLTVLLAGSESDLESVSWAVRIIADSSSPVLLFPAKALMRHTTDG